MKTIRFVAYLFYRYYSTGATKDIPYVSTLCAMVMLLGLHIFQLIVLFGLVDFVPAKVTNSRGKNFAIIALCLIPIFLILSLLIKKTDLKGMHYDAQKVKQGNLNLIIYIALSILLIPLIVFLKNGHL